VEVDRRWRCGVRRRRLTAYPKAGNVLVADAPVQSATDACDFLRPHVHYEIRVSNGHVDPRKLKRAAGPSP